MYVIPGLPNVTGSKKVVAALVARAACQMVQLFAANSSVEYVRNLKGGQSAQSLAIATTKVLQHFFFSGSFIFASSYPVFNLMISFIFSSNAVAVYCTLPPANEVRSSNTSF